MKIGEISNSYKNQVLNRQNSQINDDSGFFAELMKSNSSINVYKSQEVNKSDNNPQVEQKDYSSYNTFAELKNIPYEEAKANYEAIMKRANELRDEQRAKGFEEGTKGFGYNAMTAQLEKVHISNNDKLNKALYETLRGIKDSLDAHVMNSELQFNLENYYHGNEIRASFVYDPKIYGKDYQLTKEQLSSINVDDFFSKMINTFTKDYEAAPSYVKEQYKKIVDGYSIFSKMYSKA